MIYTHSLLAIILISAIYTIFARPQASLPIIPPELEAVLPSETVANIKAVHEDPAIGFHEKQEKIDKIMVNLPTDVLERIPLPPGFQSLPEEVRNAIKAINRNKDKTWVDKQAELHRYVQSLPAEQRAILMGPPTPQG